MVITGGYPIRVLRLSKAGARHVAAWWSGMPVPDNPKARALARRLLDTGIAHPVLDSPEPYARGRGQKRDRGHPRPGPARRTGSLPGRPGRRATGDRGRRRLPRSSRHRGRRGHGRGRRPAAAGERRAGGGQEHRPGGGETPLVAFLDSDCVPGPGWLDALLPHFADPAVGAVAPRIVPHEAGRTWLARYEGASSTLDMGQRPSIVRPGSRVPYVPGAALVVRKEAAGAGFAEDMQVGEDVDFVLAAGRGRLAGALRAGGRHGASAPGAAARVVRQAEGLRDIRGHARTAASRRGPPALRVRVDRGGLAGRGARLSGGRCRGHRDRHRPARPAAGPGHRRGLAPPGRFGRVAAGGPAGRRRDARGGPAAGQRDLPDLVAGGGAGRGRGAAAAAAAGRAGARAAAARLAGPSAPA